MSKGSIIRGGAEVGICDGYAMRGGSGVKLYDGHCISDGQTVKIYQGAIPYTTTFSNDGNGDKGNNKVDVTFYAPVLVNPTDTILFAGYGEDAHNKWYMNSSLTLDFSDGTNHNSHGTPQQGSAGQTLNLSSIISVPKYLTSISGYVYYRDYSGATVTLNLLKITINGIQYDLLQNGTIDA